MLYPAAFDGDSTPWVLLRRLRLASAPPCHFRARFAGSPAGGRDGACLPLDHVVRC